MHYNLENKLSRRRSDFVYAPTAYFIILLFSCFLSFSAFAQSISLSPNRIVLDGRENKDRVLVSNPSDTARSYRVALINRRMTEEGKYIEVDKEEAQPGELFAEGIVKFSPRSFTLEPKSSQTIRLRLKAPEDLPDGEYRSHLRVQVLPETGAPVIAEAGRVGINIRVNYGITIPVLVRKGALSYEVKVDSIELTKDPQNNQDVLVTKFLRGGTRSSYGDISVIFVDSSNKEHLLKFLPGLSLFTPNNSRVFTIPLDVPSDVTLGHGVLKVVYREQEAEGGKIIAEGTKTLQ